MMQEKVGSIGLCGHCHISEKMVLQVRTMKTSNCCCLEHFSILNCPAEDHFVAS